MAKGKILLGTLIGAAAGFVAGILTAPKSGKETRADLKLKANEKKNEMIAKGKEVRHKAGDFAEDVVTNTERATAQAADAVASATQVAAGAVTDATKEIKAKTRGIAKSTRTAISNNK